jgi:hypothetical protein
VNPPPLGSLVLYNFGNSKVFGIITNIKTDPQELSYRYPPPIFSIEILETVGRKAWWDIHELDLLTDKLQVIQ